MSDVRRPRSPRDQEGRPGAHFVCGLRTSRCSHPRPNNLCVARSSVPPRGPASRSRARPRRAARAHADPSPARRSRPGYPGPTSRVPPGPHPPIPPRLGPGPLSSAGSSPLLAPPPGLALSAPLTRLARVSGPGPQPGLTPRPDLTLRQTDAPVCPSGSFSLPHVLRAHTRDAGSGRRDGRRLRSGACSAPRTARGLTGTRLQKETGAALPAAPQPRRLSLQLLLSTGAQEPRSAAGGGWLPGIA